MAPEPKPPEPVYLGGTDLGSLLVGLQDELRTGRLTFASIAGDGEVCLLFGALVSAAFEGRVGGEAVLAMLDAPPGKVEVEPTFAMPEGQAFPILGESFSELVDRWRLAAKATSFLEEDGEGIDMDLPVAEPGQDAAPPEDAAAEIPVAPPETPCDPMTLGGNPFDAEPDDDIAAQSSKRRFADVAETTVEIDDPFAFESTLSDDDWAQGQAPQGPDPGSGNKAAGGTETFDDENISFGSEEDAGTSRPVGTWAPTSATKAWGDGGSAPDAADLAASGPVSPFADALEAADTPPAGTAAVDPGWSSFSEPDIFGMIDLLDSEEEDSDGPDHG